MINKTCFPITYSESFYKDVVKSRNENLNKFAYHNGFVVGAICARIEPLPKSDDNSTSANEGNRIYVMTLGVLAAYRNRGIGQKLVQSIFDYYQENVHPSSSPSDEAGSNNKSSSSPSLSKEELTQLQKVTEITLHVQISNVDAIKFYKEKFDFDQCEQVDNYYKRIDPPHCFVLRKKM